MRRRRVAADQRSKGTTEDDDDGLALDRDRPSAVSSHRCGSRRIFRFPLDARRCALECAAMAVAVSSADASRGRVVAWLVVAATAAVLTLAFAAPYGTLNQATYLLDPLHRAMPELFRRDWLVHATAPEQPVFGWLAHWLYVLDPEGPAAMLAASAAVTF